MLKRQPVILASYLPTRPSTFCPTSHCRTVWEQHKSLNLILHYKNCHYLTTIHLSPPLSRWGLLQWCRRSLCVPDSSAWLSPCSSRSSTPTAGWIGPARPSAAERSGRLHRNNHADVSTRTVIEASRAGVCHSIQLTSFDPGYIFDHICVPSDRHYRLSLYRPDPGCFVIRPC